MKRNRDVMYLDYINGHWESHSYSEGRRYFVAIFSDLDYAIRSYEARGYRVVVLDRTGGVVYPGRPEECSAG